MSEMTLNRAVSIVAQQVAYDTLERELDDLWDMYPELGEYDWQAVQDGARGTVSPPPVADYMEAYAYLEDRAALANDH